MRDVIFKLRILVDMLRNAYGEWREVVWRPDLDGRYCCDGRECCCGGMTRREAFRLR